MVIRNRLDSVLPRDKNSDDNGEYFIRSLYFDTPENKAFHEKIEGMALKEKYRIRSYNFNFSFIRLEKKIKEYGKGRKIRANVTAELVKNILKGDIDFLKHAEKPLLKEFYIKLLYDRWIPKVIIDFTREAFFYPAGNVRVTIDRNIRSSINYTDFFDYNLPTAPVFENVDTCILEVKYDGFLPEHVQDLIQLNSCTFTAMSKYVAGRRYM